jgi:acylphosphatase
MSEIKTERVIFRGRVQGVGFRYTVRSLANRHPVKGYVKNLPDGKVELVMQGDPTAMNDLLAEVTDHFRDNIADCDRRPIEIDEEFGHFEIRF